MPNYSLQVGAYALYADSRNLPDVGIIHVTKSDVRLVNYTALHCAEQWANAVAWYQTLNELK